MKNFEQFKKDILFNEIHNWERSDVFWDLCDEAERMVRIKKEFPRGADSYSCFVLFMDIASKINYTKNLVLLCADLKKQDYFLRKLVQTEENYYEDFFKERIKRGNSVLKKLRPYVLESTVNWTLERKQIELNKKEIEPYLRGWFCQYSS